VGFAASSQGSKDLWASTLLPLLQLSINREIKLIGGLQNLNQIFSKQDTLALIHALSQRKVHDKHLWTILMKCVLQRLKTEEWELNELAEIVKDLNVLKLKSDAFYNHIVRYITDKDLLISNRSLDTESQSYFFMALFVLNGNLNNPKFFEQMKEVIS
jgi:hypothetical protein